MHSDESAAIRILHSIFSSLYGAARLDNIETKINVSEVVGFVVIGIKAYFQALSTIGCEIKQQYFQFVRIVTLRFINSI